MADTAASIPEDDESVVNFSTLILALVTLAVYLLFLKPTADNDNTNNNDNATATNQTRQRPRGTANRRTPQPQQPPPPQARRRMHMSENAVQVLATCQALPPHVSSTTSKRSIGGFDILSENGLVAFSHTQAAAVPKQSSSTDEFKLQQRKERAKILSRLFYAKGGNGKAVPAPPSKGSTFVVSVSQKEHLQNSGQKASLIRVLKGLSSHYTVLVVVGLEDSSTTTSYETTQTLQKQVLQELRGDDDSLQESILPSHRVLLAGSAKGRVALVRQLSTNIGLTVDFDKDVKDELERFGYDVSIVNDWSTILPASDVTKP